MQVMRMTHAIRILLYRTMKAWKEAIRKQSKSAGGIVPRRFLLSIARCS
jgi:hypothetical protein